MCDVVPYIERDDIYGQPAPAVRCIGVFFHKNLPHLEVGDSGFKRVHHISETRESPLILFEVSVLIPESVTPSDVSTVQFRSFPRLSATQC